MLTPAVANFTSLWYALGNTPAVNLARGLPQGSDADVLLLGCGDVRNVLFTAYNDRNLPSRRFDITSCDIDAAIIARNIVLYTLLLDNAALDTRTAWNIYYDLYLEPASAALLKKQVENLLRLSQSLASWGESAYGSRLAFCDETTLVLVRDAWHKFSAASASIPRDAFKKELERSQRIRAERLGEKRSIFTGLRSAAPILADDAMSKEISSAYDNFWKHGSVLNSKPNIPNPLFAGALSPTTALAYGTDPILGFHLATAFTALAPSSPLRPDSVQKAAISGVANAAVVQFGEWVDAFRSMAAGGLVLRFVVADAVAFSHALQQPPGASPANIYRRQFDASVLDLDPQQYGSSSSAPRAFDVIDTSNLADHVGALNLLVAAAPLLKHSPSSTLYLETLLKRHKTQQAAFDALLKGHAPTISLLLGVSPLEFWTNATTVSTVHEILMNLQSGSNPSEPTQMHSRISWKRTKHVSGKPAGGLLRMEPQALARVFLGVYHQMFEYEDINTMKNLMGSGDLARVTESSAYPHFHRGSLVALLKMAHTTIETNWSALSDELEVLLAADKTFIFGSNYLQEFTTQMHLQGLRTYDYLAVHRNTSLGGYNSWKDMPTAVAVTVVVPRLRLDKLYATEKLRFRSPTLHGIMMSPLGTNFFADLHFVFGKIKTSGSPDKDDFKTVIEQDAAGWSGKSPLVASFFVPTAAMQADPKNRIGIAIQVSAHSMMAYGSLGLGPEMIIYDAGVQDKSVFITKTLPGMTGYPNIGGSAARDPSAGSSETSVTITANTDGKAKVVSFTGRVDINTEKGKLLLAEKVPIQLRQSSPYTINIVFGDDELVCDVTFPAPVAQDGSKTRIARKSSWVEVIAPFASPLEAGCLSEYIFPMALNRDSIPVGLNSHHLNLDALPILDLESPSDKRKRWISPLITSMFSAREKRQREMETNKEGLSTNLRLNFKETLMSLLMIATGTQGGQTGIFALQHPELGNVMLLFVRAIRLDGAAASIVADAAVLPITKPLIESGKLETFFLVLRELEVCSINVDDEELRLWKRVVPALAERCRTWSHGPDCEYKAAGASVPLSLHPEEAFMCSCGNGKLPDDFMTIPEWGEAAKHATRVAISPTFSAPFVEDLIDMNMLELGGGMEALNLKKCRTCSKTEEMLGQKLMACAKCRDVYYCCRECQRADWKTHRMECS